MDSSDDQDSLMKVMVCSGGGSRKDIGPNFIQIPKYNVTSRIDSNPPKKSPMKSVMEELGKRLGGLQERTELIRQEFSAEADSLISKVHASQNHFEEIAEKVQKECLNECNNLRDQSSQQYKSLYERIGTMKKDHSFPLKEKLEDDIAALEGEIFFATSLSRIDDKLCQIEGDDIMLKSDYHQINSEIDDLKEQLALKIDVKVLKEKLSQIYDEFSPKSDVEKLNDTINLLSRDIVPQSTFLIVQDNFNNMKKEYEEFINDIQAIGDFEGRSEALDVAIKRIEYDLRTLENQFGESNAINDPLSKKVQDNFRLAGTEWMNGETILEKMRSKMNTLTREDYELWLEKIRKRLDKFVTKNKLDQMEASLRVQSENEETVKDLQDRLAKLEDTFNKVDPRNLDLELNKLESLSRKPWSSKSIGDTVRKQDLKIEELRNNFEGALKSLHTQVVVSFNKSIESVKADVTEKCTQSTREYCEPLVSSLKHDIEKSLDKDLSVFCKSDEAFGMAQAVCESLQSELSSRIEEVKKELNEAFLHKFSVIKQDVTAECNKIKARCQEDYKKLCKQIQRSLNESLENANAGLLSNFQSLRTRCLECNNILKGEIKEKFETIKDEILKNNDKS